MDLAELIQQGLEEAEYRRAHNGRSRQEDAEYQARIEREIFAEDKESASKLHVGQKLTMKGSPAIEEDCARWTWEIEGFVEDFPIVYVKILSYQPNGTSWHYTVSASYIRKGAVRYSNLILKH